jgi:NAD(P)-dependent dehydrogenase (short-subunit alcohol dehydrogenase family)
MLVIDQHCNADKKGNIMTDRTVLVTGGAQGIGRATIAACLDKGWNAVAMDVDAEALNALDQELDHAGRLLCIKGPNHDEPGVRDAVARSVETFGGLTGLVNNAGFSRNMPLEDLSLEDWSAVIATNLTGGFLCAKHAAPHLRKAKGAIVNLASTRAFMSEADTEAYSASKGGVFGLTHALAASLAPDVRVNAISPGWIATQAWQKPATRQEPELSPEDHGQHWSGRVGAPPDVASMAVYLLSDEAGFITGANMVIDGGMTRKMIYTH